MNLVIKNRMEDDPAYDISVSSDEQEEPPERSRVRAAIDQALRRHGAAAARINVALVSDGHIAKLNEQYLHHAGATDVLTFDLRDDTGSAAPVSQGCGEDNGRSRGLRIDGEIFVSTETAAREARQRGHSLEAELALYAVHGTLHLLGYDDAEQAAAARMHALEDEILIAIGLGAVYGTRPK